MQGKKHRDRYSRGELEVMVERLAEWLYEQDGNGEHWYRERSVAMRTLYMRRAKIGISTILGVDLDARLQ